MVPEPVAAVCGITDDERMATLRMRCRQRKSTAGRPGHVAILSGAVASAGLSRQRQRGAICRARLESMRFAVDDLELLAGRLAPLTGDELARERSAAEQIGEFWPPGGQTGHCEPDRERLFDVGVGGLLADLQKRLAGTDGDRADAVASFIDALEGFSAMAGHAAEAVESAMVGASAERRRELAEMAESCRHIASQPPRTFRDAIQLTWLMDLAIMYGDMVGLVVAGRLDRTLHPFFLRDSAAGILTEGQALALIESLYILTNEYIPDGLAMSVMVGGTDGEGADTTNRLSFLCLEALRRTRLVYPTVGICMNPGTPEELIRLGVEIVGEGCPNPAFFGDATIRRGLESLGVPRTESGNYVNSTCVEITPVGRSNVWVASPYFSTCAVLLEEIAARAGIGEPAGDFDGFLDAYCHRLGARIAAAVSEQNRLREQRRERGRKPLQSVFTRGCIESGRDIDDGGAPYNWVECSFVGLANLVDSLRVIRGEVSEHRTMGFAELEQVLKADFEGAPGVRSRFGGYPKYGNIDASVDALMDTVVARIRDECARHRMLPDDSPFVPGAFCWVMHERLGHECGATPDGRRAGQPFADGCGPAQGRETCGPTAAILSATSWDQSPLIGGAAFNMKLSKSLFRSRSGFDGLAGLVRAFIERGGFETQINVVDADELEAAREHPEAHADLVVRIGGYTDYFVRLSPEMQDEVIRRTRFAEI